MGLMSFFGMSRPFSYSQVIAKYGLQALAGAMSIIIRAKFAPVPSIRTIQVIQFLREEADAMFKAGGEPAQIAMELFDDEEEFVGAMDEEAPYPIDYPGGPQQTLVLDSVVTRLY